MGSTANPAGGGSYSVNTVGYMNGSAALSEFMPDAAPGQGKQAINRGGIQLSEAIRRRVSEWFQQQATLRLARQEKP